MAIPTAPPAVARTRAVAAAEVGAVVVLAGVVAAHRRCGVPEAHAEALARGPCCAASAWASQQSAIVLETVMAPRQSRRPPELHSGPTRTLKLTGLRQ